MRILIVEDEKAIAEVEKAYLEKEGYMADIAEDGLEAIEFFNSGVNYDLLILDIMLPGMQGDEICRNIRLKSQVPIIMVTARSSEDDVVLGLNAGADDYIIKPFSPKVLMARVRANLRKSLPMEEMSHKKVFVTDSLFVDYDTYTVVKNGIQIPMTKNEFLLFSTMAENPEKTWSRDELITHALGYEYDGFERSIDSYIKNIRKKLSDDEHENGYIKTVHGFGYIIAKA
ncbi:MAG: response regulator transcription factor [Synergistaceae bacterium]